MDILPISQGDTAPLLIGDLTFKDGTLPDLSNATVNVVLRDPNASAPFLNAACTVTWAKDADGKPTQATATYAWQPGDTNTPGFYLGQFEVTFPDTSVRSFPEDEYFGVEVTTDLTSTFTPNAEGTTLADLLASIRRRIGGRAPKQNLLREDVTSDPADIQIICKYPATNLAVGAVLSVGTETMYVWEKSSDGLTLTVQRAYAGSKATAHASGDLILIDPTFTDYEVLTEINKELTALPSRGLYNRSTADLISDNILIGYPLPADLVGEDVLGVSWLLKSPIMYRSEITNYKVEVGVPTAEFPTGNAIFLYDKPLPGQPFRVTYKASFSPLVFTSQAITDTGLSGSAVDVLEMGAAIRVTDGFAIPRADYSRQPDSRRAAEVPVRDVLSAPGALRSSYAQRLAEEIGKLDAVRPMRLARRSIW